MQNTNSDIIEHWYPFSAYEGASCDPKDVFGCEFDPASILQEYCAANIESWLQETERRPDPWAPKYINARMVFRGKTWTASAQIEKDAEIDIVEAE